jgi:hypothetical protein
MHLIIVKMTKHFGTHQLYPLLKGSSRSELTDIDGKACNNIQGAVNKLALSARVDNSCETG